MIETIYQRRLSMIHREKIPKTFLKDPLLPTELVERIRNHATVDDFEFDQIYPPYYQAISSIQWSSLAVAQHISLWINGFNKSKFIDIGCGVGKLCLLLRFLTSHRIFGIEQRGHLVDIANQIVALNSLSDISILNMNMMDLDWSHYDIYYLYNPFQEHRVQIGLGIVDYDIALDKKYYEQYISEVVKQLNSAELGKYLITFHGFGGSIPPSWGLVTSKFIDGGSLELWVKES